MTKKLIYVLVLILVSVSVKSQDTYFSQFFANKLDLNPAFAGSQYYHRVIVNYRNQWSNLYNPYVTYSISYDRFLNGFGGYGMQLVQDRQANGAQVTTTIKGIYSYMLKINDNSAIRMALSAAIIKNQIDPSSLKFPDMIDPNNDSVHNHDNSYDPIIKSKQDFDISIGLLAHTGVYHFGFSAQHLSRPSISFLKYSRLPYKYVAHFGAEFPILTNGLRPVYFNISPLFLFQAQDYNIQMNYGFYVTRSSLVLGTWFRQNIDLKYNSMIFMGGFDNDYFRLVYSYDFAFNHLSEVGSAVHELSFIFLMGEGQTNKRNRQVPCPKFFRKMNIVDI